MSHLNRVFVSGVAKALEEKYKPEQTEFVGVKVRSNSFLQLYTEIHCWQIKVAFQMDLSGIIRIEKAEAVIQRKSQGVVECKLLVIELFFFFPQPCRVQNIHVHSALHMFFFCVN